jgi:hypothetical protein
MKEKKDIFNENLFVGDHIVWGYAGQGSSLGHGEIIDISEEDREIKDWRTGAVIRTEKQYNLRVNDGHSRRWLGHYRDVVKVKKP